MTKKVALIIRDGWGHGKAYEGNAVLLANTPNHDHYTTNYPTTVLSCTGNAVGNPDGVQGGSEVGHLIMGAGRIVWQPYEMINQSIQNGDFFTNKVFLDAINHAKTNNTNLHISGLFSSEGVHGDYKHLLAILDMCKRENLNNVFIHLCLDGRDMPEKSALPLFDKFEKEHAKIGVGKIITVFGRYYGMDRDSKWDRTLEAYNAIVESKGYEAKNVRDAINNAYQRGEKTDYYVKPTIIVDDTDQKPPKLKDNDSFLWFNFRTDRSRQITSMLNDFENFREFTPQTKVKIHYACMCKYDDKWNLPVAFYEQKVNKNLGKILSERGLKQLRISETEKYAHVTFFFNSQEHEAYQNETRMMVESPRLPSFDLKPEMSVFDVTEKLLPEIPDYDFILVNFVNADLVGHSAVLEAGIKACEAVDECVGKTVKELLNNDFTILLTADHGNADHMIIEETGEPDPSHGYNPVQFTIISNDENLKDIELKSGRGLQDVAPTILDIMGIEKPEEMTGQSLIKR